jgi:hypothetical protein
VPGQTISDDFTRDPNGLVAESVLGGNTVYINPGLIGGNKFVNEAFLLHEGLHGLGLGDEDIQTRLGIDVNPKNTKNIADKLYTDCVKGKNNF